MTAAQTVAELHMLRKRCAELEEQLEAQRAALQKVSWLSPYGSEAKQIADAALLASIPVSAPDLDATSNQNEAFSEGNDGGSGAEASSPAKRPQEYDVPGAGQAGC